MFFDRGEFFEATPQPFQLPPAHRPLLEDPVGAFGEDIELAVLGQQFDLHPLARFLPGLVEEQLLKLGQAPLRGADQIAHRRIALPHLGQNRLGRDAAIHQPDAPRLAVLRRDLGEKRPQGLVVLGVTGENLVGQRQAFRRDHQGDHHLRAIRPAVAAVAVPALVAVRQGRGVDLESKCWSDRRATRRNWR